jgi:hypothetical protein
MLNNQWRESWMGAKEQRRPTIPMDRDIFFLSLLHGRHLMLRFSSPFPQHHAFPFLFWAKLDHRI